MIEKPFAFCCAEAGGDPAICDCVNKSHGTAMFAAVCIIPNAATVRRMMNRSAPPTAMTERPAHDHP